MDRWRSLTIFCDRWEPFIQAFQILNTSTPAGAPCMEILEVLECQSYGDRNVLPPVINPAPRSERMASRLSLKSLFPSGDIMIGRQNILPRLRRLSLRGVPMNWIALLEQLSATAVFPSLHYLELSLFCAGGQAPTSREFSAILTAFPNLRKLALKIFRLSDYKIGRVQEPVTLLQLDEISLEYGSGYNDTEHTKDVLQHINAPTLARLSIMPRTHDALHSGPDPQPLITYALEWCSKSMAELRFHTAWIIHTHAVHITDRYLHSFNSTIITSL